VQVTYDKTVDATYIYFMPKGTKSALTVPVDPEAVKGMINLDFDANGEHLGIEIIGASNKFDEETFNKLVDMA